MSRARTLAAPPAVAPPPLAPPVAAETPDADADAMELALCACRARLLAREAERGGMVDIAPLMHAFADHLERRARKALSRGLIRAGRVAA